MLRREFHWLRATISAFASVTPFASEAQVPAGSEFQVNSYTTNGQVAVSVAMDADGDFVVVWESAVGDGSGTALQGQRYAATGTPQGEQFLVNTSTAGNQRAPSVAAADDGSFIVVWSTPVTGGNVGVQARRFTSDGTPQGAQFAVNTYTTGPQDQAAVDVGGDGSFVIVWRSDGSLGSDTDLLSIQGQRFAADGTPQGGEFQINSYITSNQIEPAVDVDADGDFVVAWESTGSYGTDTHFTSIQAQRYASNGSQQGGQFQVNTYTTFRQNSPAVGADPDGDFVIVWESNGSSGADASAYSIQGQRYASDGSAVGGNFEANVTTTGTQLDPAIAMDGDGNFVVAWESASSAGTDTNLFSLQAQRFSFDGFPQGQFQVNTYTTSSQVDPAVAQNESGAFVVVWESTGSFGTDSSGASIQGQRYLPEPENQLGLAAGLLLLGLRARRARRRLGAATAPMTPD